MSLLLGGNTRAARSARPSGDLRVALSRIASERGYVDEVIAPRQTNVADLQRRVRETEQAFAKTMADRDHSAFVSFLSEEAISISETQTLRGRQQVAAG